MDLGVLKRIVEERVVDKIDHKNFNLDVDFMRGVIPTSENIIVAIWRELAPAIAPAPPHAAACCGRRRTTMSSTTGD